jgi:hypothetical protein
MRRNGMKMLFTSSLMILSAVTASPVRNAQKVRYYAAK